MSNKEFEEWATSKGFSLEPGSVENGKGGRTYADDRTHYALLGYLHKQFSAQPEIDALKAEVERLRKAAEAVMAWLDVPAITAHMDLSRASNVDDLSAELAKLK